MSRSTPEWHGKNDDTPIPPRVLLRVFRLLDGHCAKCGRKLRAGHWAADHIVALVNGGENRENNLQPLCISPCHSAKTADDVAEKSITYRQNLKQIGIKRKSYRPLPGSKASGWRRRMNGTLERR